MIVFLYRLCNVLPCRGVAVLVLHLIGLIATVRLTELEVVVSTRGRSEMDYVRLLTLSAATPAPMMRIH